MLNVNLIALDMDGVVNSNDLIQAWIDEARVKYYKETKDERLLETLVYKEFKEVFDRGRRLIFPELADKVTKLCRETDSYILWSTSWRLVEPYRSDEKAIRKLFDDFNMPSDRFLGCTPRFNAYRGVEINAWIESNKFFKPGDLHKCAVLDDLAEAGQGLSSKCRLFKTDVGTGITDSIVNEAKKFLLEE